MTRIHPDYMKNALDAGKAGDFDGYNENIAKGLEYWTKVFRESIGHMSPIEAPLIITALKEMADAYTEALPGSKEAVDWIRSRVERKVVVIHIRHE